MRAPFVVLIALTAIARADDGASHVRAALRLGEASSSYTVNYESATPSASGVLVDAEVGYRFGPYFSVAGFVAHHTISVSGSFSDFGTNTFDEVHHIYDAGVRVQGHFEGAFFGIGVGDENVRTSGHYTCLTGGAFQCNPIYDKHESRWQGATLLELHAGYAFPLQGGVSIEIFAAVTRAGLEFTEDGLWSKRIALGVSF